MSPPIIRTGNYRAGPNAPATFSVLVLYSFGEVVALAGYSDGHIDSIPFQQFVTDSIATDLAIGDINRDGVIDFAVSHLNRQKVSLHFGLPDFTYTSNSSDSVAVPGMATGLVIADYNHDGDPDLVVSTSGPDALALLSGNGDGTFSPDTVILQPATLRDFVVADITGDDKLDIAVATGTPSQLTVYTNDGTGTFVLTPTYTTLLSGEASSITVVDVDGINGNDLAVAYLNGLTFITVLTNTGSGSFIASQYQTILDGHSRIAAGDITGDGIVDLLITSDTHDTLIVLTGLPDGSGSTTFCCPYLYPLGDGPVGLVLGDVNGDGQIDLIALNQNSDDLSVLTGLIPPRVGTLLQVTQPNGGERFIIDSTYQLSWSKDSGVASVDIGLSRDGGLTWELIAQHQSGTSFDWLATADTSAVALVRITQTYVSTNRDVSDSVFCVTQCCIGQTGNVDCDLNDGSDISDLSTLIDNLYISFSPLCCPTEANTDGQPGIDISDLSALIDYLYISFTPTAACQ